MFLFRGLTYDFFKVSSFYFLKGGETPQLNSENVKVTKNIMDFYLRKWNSIIEYPSEIKNFYLLLQFLQNGLILSKVLELQRGSRLFFFLSISKLN